MLLPNPKPCDCSQAESELRLYSDAYFSALEDLGNTKQTLKGCMERL